MIPHCLGRARNAAMQGESNPAGVVLTLIEVLARHLVAGKA